MLLLTVLLAVFRWESGGVMDGHDAKIHSDQHSGNTGRLSSTVPDWSEGDSTESQWLHANLFLLSINNICAELTTVLANTGAALSLWPGSARWALGLRGRGELAWSWQAKVPLSLGWADPVSCPCTQIPLSRLNGTLVSPWPAILELCTIL